MPVGPAARHWRRFLRFSVRGLIVLERLTRLDLSGTSVSDDGLGCLATLSERQRALPSLRIHR